MTMAKSIFSPIVTLHNSFIRYRRDKFYQIQMDYQTCYLESFLNDRFDFTQRRIYIQDAETGETIYLFQRAENNPLLIYKRSENKPQPLYTRGESNGDLLNDFVVYVPLDVVFDEHELRAMIGSKICGKRFKVQTF
jgi:hypothetical protein